MVARGIVRREPREERCPRILRIPRGDQGSEVPFRDVAEPAVNRVVEAPGHAREQAACGELVELLSRLDGVFGVYDQEFQGADSVRMFLAGNSLRALVKYLDGISDQEIVELNIPTGIPLVYELSESLKPLRHYYLGDPDAARKAAEAVARQGTRQ